MGRLLFTTVHGKSVHRLHSGKNTCDYVQEYFKGATIFGITFNCHLLKRLGMGTPAVTIQTKPNAELTSILPTSPKAMMSTQMFYPLQEKQEIKGRFLPGTPGAKHPLLAGNRTVIKGKENSSGCTSRTSVPLWRRAEEVNLYFLLREKQMWKTWRAEFCCVLPC